jgi:CRISPR-associated protein Csb1
MGELLNNIEKSTYLLLTEKLVAPLQRVNMPSYAGAKKGEQCFVTWKSPNGSINAQLDSIQSQANRIEPVFEQYAELVPAIQVEYPNGTKLPLLEEPHRAAAPMIRYYFTSELEALKGGDAAPLARRNPTALIFGLDARTMWVKQQRIITSTIEVRGAVRRPSGSSLSSPLDDETRQQLVEVTGMDASEIGIDQVPVFKEDSGTLDTTDATIVRRTEFPLTLLDKYEPVLRDYLKGLALVAFLYPIPLTLRSGTSLVRQSRTLEAFSDFELTSKQVSLDGAFEDALAFARTAAQQFGIGQAETLVVDVKKVEEGAKAQKTAEASKAAKAAAKAERAEAKKRKPKEVKAEEKSEVKAQEVA